MDELFAVSPGAVFMGSAESTEPVTLWWQVPSVSGVLLLSPPWAHFCCDF